MIETIEKAILAGGCFRGMQDLLRKRPGVISTRVGYTGGDVPNATYRHHGTHAEAIEIVFGKRRTTGMREGNGRVLHRRPSESRWPRPCVGDPRGRSEALDRGARRPAIEPRHGSYLGVPTRSKTSEGNTAGGVIASRPRAPRGLRTRACVRALHAENREISRSPACRDGGAGRAGKAKAVIP